MLRWLSALAIASVLSGFAFLLVTGRYINDGPVVLSLTEDHGLHLGDLFVVTSWLVGMAAVGVLVARGGRATSA